jgi:uncharacterized membrane protein
MEDIMATKRITGPIQVFVIGFDKADFGGQVLAELKRVRKRGVMRLVDLLFVSKAADGTISSSMHMSDLSEAERLRMGRVAGGLIGLEVDGLEGAVAGADLGELRVAVRDYGMSSDQLADLADSIPAGSAAAIMVVEHHWAARLRDAIGDAGGQLLVQAMISPDLLLTVGAGLEARLEAEEAIEMAEIIKVAAAMEVAQVLATAELIEVAAMTEAAEVVAMALAIEDAAAQEATDALIVAGLIEEAAAEEAAEVVATAIAIEDEAIEEAIEVVEVAEEIKAEAAIEVLRALYVAKVIEDEAAREAVDALVAAEIIEEAAAEEAAASIRAADQA